MDKHLVLNVFKTRVKHLMSVKNKILKVLAIIVVLGIWINQTYLPLTLAMMVYEADAYSRLWHILYLPLSNIWLPGFQYIMRLFSIIPDNGLFLNYRLGIYIFTIALSIIIFFIIQKNTKSFLPSLVGLSLFLFHPLTKQLSVITLTEIPWLFFLFLSIYFLFFTKYKNKIFLGLFSFVISETFRYESWFLMAILIPYLFFIFRTNRSTQIKSILFVIVFPIFWMLILTKFYNSPVSFFFEKLKCSRGESNLFFLNINELWNLLSRQISNYIFPTSLVFLFLLSGLFLRKIKVLPVSIVSIYLFLCFFLETLTSFNENTSPRFLYFLVPSLAIIIPICLYNICLIYKNLFELAIIAYCVFAFLYNPFLKLNDDYYTKINESDMCDIEETFLILKKNQPKKIYMCNQADDYFFSYLILYHLEYKNIYFDCNNDFHILDSSSNIIISSQDEKFYDSKINYSKKNKLFKHIIYTNK